jgi:flagellar biosynthesis chaperone FliJ
MGLRRVWQQAARGVEKVAQRIPAVQKRLEAQYAQVEQMVREQMRPKLDALPDFAELPDAGVSREQILDWMQQLRTLESPLWHARACVGHGLSWRV